MSIWDTSKLRGQLASLDLEPDQRAYYEELLNDIEKVGQAVRDLYKKYPELGNPEGGSN